MTQALFSFYGRVHALNVKEGPPNGARLHLYPSLRRQQQWFLWAMDNYTQQTVRDHEADRQTRELYRYFQPVNPAASEHSASTKSTNFVVQDEEVSETASIKASPLYSPNKTFLTSLAQLAVLRLNAERALIMYIRSCLLP